MILTFNFLTRILDLSDCPAAVDAGFTACLTSRTRFMTVGRVQFHSLSPFGGQVKCCER